MCLGIVSKEMGNMGKTIETNPFTTFRYKSRCQERKTDVFPFRQNAVTLTISCNMFPEKQGTYLDS